MTLPEFCSKISKLALSHVDLALAILWFEDEKQADVSLSAGRLAKVINEAGLGNSNSTKLGEGVRKSGKVIETKAGFRLKVLARSQIREKIKAVFEDTVPSIDHDLGYISEGIWRDTRVYIEKVCEQLNGCYQLKFYDAASVMMRRFTETLLIEAYEHLNRGNEIKDQGGNFLMLRDLISCATGQNAIGLGRDARDALGKIKELGDRSAHNRRFVAIKSDLDRIQSGLRVVAGELIVIANLKKARS